MVHWCCAMDVTVSRSPNKEQRQKSCTLNPSSISSQSQEATERPLSLHLHHPSCVRPDDEMQVHLHSGCTGNYNTLMILMDRELVIGLEVYFWGPLPNIIDGIYFFVNPNDHLGEVSLQRRLYWAIYYRVPVFSCLSVPTKNDLGYGRIKQFCIY